MANPKEWGALGGQTTAVVETPFTKRAQELRELYNALKAPLLTIDQRLDVLLHVKWTAKVGFLFVVHSSRFCRNLIVDSQEIL